jgi:hypothetical protein
MIAAGRTDHDGPAGHAKITYFQAGHLSMITKPQLSQL